MNSSQKSAAVIRLLLAFLVLTVALGLLFKAASSPATAKAGRAAQSQTVDAERSLDINRYANEPLELVDLKIGPNSVKSGIKVKFKVPLSEDSFDNVKFREKDNWFKNVKIRLRNISGKPIYGLDVDLYFKSSALRMFYGIPLTPAQTRNLQQQPINPGEELDLQVADELYNPMIARMRQDGVEPNEAQVGLSVNRVYFANDIAWRRGVLMRRNPYGLNSWEGVDKGDVPPTPSPQPSREPSPGPFEASQLFQLAGFKILDIKFVSPTMQGTDAYTCTTHISA